MTKQKRRSGVSKLVLLSDFHVGSTKAILPPGFTTLEGNKVSLNAMQEWLWMCWIRANDLIDEVVGDEPFALVLNGDLIEGVHHGTKEIWSPNVNDHVNSAIELLAPLASRAEKLFIIKGTECHTGVSEIGIADALLAEMDHTTGVCAFDRLTLDINGVRHVFRHHIGTSVRRGLAGTQLSANLAEEQVEAVNNGEPIPRVVCCAHRHKVGLYQDDNGICLVSPPWQGLTRFGHKVVSQARTKPGLIIIDSKDTKYGALPNVIQKTYECPSPQAISLD